MRFALPLFVCVAAATAAAVSATPILFGGGDICVSSDGRQGHCVPAAACPLVTGPVLPSCVQPCRLRRGQLEICCVAPAAPPAPQCGVSGATGGGGPVPNVSMGRTAARGRWPWLALVGMREPAGPRWLCGGALLGPRHVLTAAHCVSAAAERLLVRLGEHDLTTAADGAHQQVAVRRVARHPQRRGSQHDVALLELAAPAEFGPRVRPICLPQEGRAEEAGATVRVAGWGRLEFAGETSPVLQEAKLRLVESDACEAAYRRLVNFDVSFPGGFNGTKLCAEDPRGRGADACQGDSGGPLMAAADDGTFAVIGVVSAGVGCGSPDFPGLYTRVASYLDWIRSEMA